MRILLSTLTAAGLLTNAALAADPGQKLIDIENAMAKAFVAGDVAMVDGTIADDWTMQNDAGKLFSKADFVPQFKAGKATFKMMTCYNMKARVLGNIAVVQGMDNESSSVAGRDTSGTYTWLDVFEMRGDKWVMIATQISKVKK